MTEELAVRTIVIKIKIMIVTTENTREEQSYYRTPDLVHNRRTAHALPMLMALLLA